MIRVTFDDGTVADLLEDTPADPFGEPGADEKPMTLEEVRFDRTVHVFINGVWRVCQVESWQEEAQRMQTERDAEKARADDAVAKFAALATASGVLDKVDAHVTAASWKVRAEEAEKRLADLRAWAEGQSFGSGDDAVLRYLDAFQRVVDRIDGKGAP